MGRGVRISARSAALPIWIPGKVRLAISRLVKAMVDLFPCLDIAIGLYKSVVSGGRNSWAGREDRGDGIKRGKSAAAPLSQLPGQERN